MTLLRHVGGALVGAAVALGAVAVHRSLVPLGLLLALAATGGAAEWLRRSRHPQVVASYAAGWVALFVLVMLGRPEGDYVLAGDLTGYGLMAGGITLVVVGVVSLPGRSGPRT